MTPTTTTQGGAFDPIDNALSECLSALRAIKANGGDPEDVNRAAGAIERVEALHASPDKMEKGR